VAGQQQAAQQQQGKGNPLRDHLKKVEDQNTALQQQVAKLVAQQRQTQIADELQAKGYSRAVAGLYGGEPEKLDEWLTTVGPLLAKDPTVTTDAGQTQQQGQAPASTVPADGQAALQQLQGMGQNAAAPSGTEAEQMAQINAQNVYMANQTNRDAQRAATQQEWIKNGNRDAPVLPASTSSPASIRR